LLAIEKASKAGDARLLRALIERRDTIAAALAAPEHSVPIAEAPNKAELQWETREQSPLPALANSCA
jgi:hypothetical protein